MNQELRFSTSCPSCGEVELAAEQMWLVLTSGTDDAHFDFECPGCAVHVRHQADQATAAFLAEVIAVEELDVPTEALETHEGPALTMDDLLDLMLSLGTYPSADGACDSGRVSRRDRWRRT